MATTFTNPIMPGFSPDPSMVLVDSTFFLVTSSFHVFPGIPIYASRNLKEWTHIGNAINRHEQLSLNFSRTLPANIATGEAIIGMGGLFAPTIRYHKGTFYVICTNFWAKELGSNLENDKGVGLQNFYVTTTDIWSDKWSDPILYDFQGIDPSLFFDDDDRVYVQGCWSFGDWSKQPTCTIKQFEIDIKTGKPLSEPKEIWGGFAKHDTEGPHIYKKDGWFYLLVAEGGTFEHHMLSIGRSKNIWGPYESYENNPVLTADGKDEYFQNTGHGELFQDEQGLWWAVGLAVRNADGTPLGRFHLGRETILTPVEWPQDGWPKFQHPRRTMDRKGAKVLSLPNDLPKQKSRVDDVYIRDAVLSNYEFTESENGNSIKLLASTTDLSTSSGTVSFVGKRQRALDCVSETTLLISDNPKSHKLKAGLTVYKDDHRHAEIFFDYDSNKVQFNQLNKIRGSSNSAELPLTRTASISFQIRATETNYKFSYRQNVEDSWKSLGEVDVIELSARDMTGPLFGVFASAAVDGVPAVFTDFAIRGD